MPTKKIIYILASLLLVVVSVGHAANEVPNQFRIYKKRLNSKWWLSTSYLHDGYTFDSANAAGSVNNKGDSDIYRAEVSRFFLGKKLVVSALYKRLTTNSESNSLIGTTSSQGFSKISGNLFGLNIKKVFGGYFYLATYGVYGPTHFRLSVSNQFIGTGLSAAGKTTYNGNFWYVGANTGALVPVGTHWLIGGILNFVYVESSTDPYTLPQSGLLPISQSASSITTANLLQSFVVKYLIAKHIRPYINAGLIEVLSQNVTNPSAALLSAPVPDLLLGHFGYNAGGGLEYISHKVTFHIGYLYNRRESTYHSNFVYLRLSIFT